KALLLRPNGSGYGGACSAKRILDGYRTRFRCVSPPLPTLASTRSVSRRSFSKQALREARGLGGRDAGRDSARAPPAHPVAIDRRDRFGDAMPLSPLVDGLPARGDGPVVVGDRESAR